MCVDNEIETIRLELEEGQFVLAEIQNMDSEHMPVSHIDYNFKDISKQIEGISKLISESFDKVKPNKINIELSIGFSIETDGVVAILLKGNSNANLKINLEWSNK